MWQSPAPRLPAGYFLKLGAAFRDEAGGFPRPPSRVPSVAALIPKRAPDQAQAWFPPPASHVRPNDCSVHRAWTLGAVERPPPGFPPDDSVLPSATEEYFPIAGEAHRACRESWRLAQPSIPSRGLRPFPSLTKRSARARIPGRAPASVRKAHREPPIASAQRAGATPKLVRTFVARQRAALLENAAIFRPPTAQCCCRATIAKVRPIASWRASSPNPSAPADVDRLRPRTPPNPSTRPDALVKRCLGRLHSQPRLRHPSG